MNTERDIFNFICGDTMASDFEPQEDLIFGGLGYQKPKPIGKRVSEQEEQFEDVDEEEWDDEEDENEY